MNSLLVQGREWEPDPAPDEHLVREIVASLGCAPALGALLAHRGGAEWRNLLDPGASQFHSPLSLSGMDAAMERVIVAISRGERVFIHGDFDVDGLTGAAILYLGLAPLFPRSTIKVEVGDRRHGHGLSRAFVLRAIDEGFNLVITVDCGISNVDEVAMLREAGVDTVITDHHVPPAELPPAVAIIDPQLPGETYPNQHLAGVGVAYKFLSALYERLGKPVPYQLLDLVGLGTIADLVPLAAGGEVENRALVREAFAVIARGEGASLGLRVLMNRLSINPKRLTASDIGYIIAPKLNAANRAGDPKVAFLLLTTKVQERAEYLSEVLLDYNRDREVAQGDLIAQAADELVRSGSDPQRDGMIILSGKYWNEGIIGLAASNLAERYRVPTVIISRGDKVSRGSCRSVDGFDIIACLRDNANLFLHYGGHKMAAGFTVKNELLPLLRDRLIDCAVQRRPADHKKKRRFDASINAAQIDTRFYANIRSLAPYGPGNPPPLFHLPDCLFSNLSLVGAQKQHLKGTVSQNGVSLPLIAFRMGRHIEAFEQASGNGLIFRPGFDDWRGTVQVEGVDLVDE